MNHTILIAIFSEWIEYEIRAAKQFLCKTKGGKLFCRHQLELLLRNSLGWRCLNQMTSLRSYVNDFSDYLKPAVWFWGDNKTDYDFSWHFCWCVFVGELKKSTWLSSRWIYDCWGVGDFVCCQGWFHAANTFNS